MKVRIKKLPRTYKLEGRKLVKRSHGGRTGNQYDYGLVTLPEYNIGGHYYMEDKESKVKSTLGPIPRELANLEAERGETALTDLNQDGTFELYNIGGNRHSSGGTPLNLPEQSFIYSDTRAMKLDRKDLKELGVNDKKKMTPADVSKKFPLNKYYEALDNADPSDHIANNTAEYMLEKNKRKLSHLAYLQEAKKGFEEGVPTAAFPYLKEKGIDPIKFTAEVEGINEQEVQMREMMSMPVDVQEKLMQLQQMIAMSEEQAQQPPQVSAEGVPMQPAPQAMPPQGMMPPQQMMARYGGYVPEYGYGGDLPLAFWGKAMDYVQGGLSAVGMIPGVGLIADAANTAISGGRAAYAGFTGDTEARNKHLGNMALNATAMIPGVGQIATATKAGKGVAAATKAKTISKTAGLIGDDVASTAANVGGKYMDKLSDVAKIGDSATETVVGSGQAANLYKKGDFIADEAKGEGKINQSNKPKYEDLAATTDADPTATEQVTDESTGGVEETVAATTEATQEAEASPSPEATTVSASTPTMEADDEVALNDQEVEEDPIDDVVADSSDMEEEPMAYEPQSSGEEEEYVPQSQRTQFGGDPFRQKSLREFIYGGAPMYQGGGSNTPMHESGVTQKQADIWMEDGYVWADTDEDGVGDTWTHTIYGDTQINEQMRRANEGELVRGTGDIGEEGIESMQDIRDDGTFAGDEDDEFSYEDFMNRHGELINQIDADEDGVPDYQDREFDMGSKEDTEAFQDAYNAELCKQYDASQALQEQYASCDEYIVAAGGFHGENATTSRDGKFGEYTYTRPSFAKEDPCPEDVKAAKMAECEEQGLPFNLEECACGEAEDPCPDEEEKKKACDEAGDIWDSANCICQKGPEDVEEVDDVNPEFWLQDRLGIMNAIDNKFRIKKRYPWTPIEETQQIDPVFQDPTRAYASIGEQATAAAQTASAFSGPQRAAAVQAKAQGAAAEQIANVAAQVQGANVGIANEAMKQNAILKADTERTNKANLKKLYDDTMLVEQNYDNAISKANTELTKQIQNAYTNRADTYNLNTLYPQFNIDPRSGGLIEVTNQRDNVPTQRSEADKAAEYQQLIEQCAGNNADKTCPPEMQKIIWKQVYGSGGGDNNNTEDSWKDVALNQGTNPVQQRYGGERKANLLKKGKQLRKWFSPLRGN
tara:strand:+ start:4109 stop:7609 length:3501 start_codon:yes stop_codon:yes gene_type:complete